MKKWIILFVLFAFCLTSCNTDDDGTGTVTDYDGNVYETVKIGEQWWMAENLNVTHFNNGDTIGYKNEDNWYGHTSSAYCYYDDDITHGDTYGALYNALAVIDSRGLAPEGWHVPSDEEWNELQLYLGMRPGQIDSSDYSGNDIGFKLKSESGWDDYVDSDPAYGGNGTDEAGFCALPGGWRWNYGDCFELGKNASFWTSTAYNENRYWYRAVNNGSLTIARDQNFVSFGFSVRCVKDDD